jgi:hypothetical protein
MNEAQFALGISREFGQAQGVIQTELHPKKPQIVKELNGVGIIHAEGL